MGLRIQFCVSLRMTGTWHSGWAKGFWNLLFFFFFILVAISREWEIASFFLSGPGGAEAERKPFKWQQDGFS